MAIVLMRRRLSVFPFDAHAFAGSNGPSNKQSNEKRKQARGKQLLKGNILGRLKIHFIVDKT
jgi:hypothetical protein